MTQGSHGTEGMHFFHLKLHVLGCDSFNTELHKVYVCGFQTAKGNRARSTGQNLKKTGLKWV